MNLSNFTIIVTIVTTAWSNDNGKDNNKCDKLIIFHIFTVIIIVTTVNLTVHYDCRIGK